MVPGVTITEPAVDALDNTANDHSHADKRGSMFTEGRRSMAEDPLLKPIHFDDDHAPARHRHRHTPMPDLAPNVWWQRLEGQGAGCAALRRRNHEAVGYQDRHGNERFVVLGGECEPKPRCKEMKSLQLNESPVAETSLSAPPEWKTTWGHMREEFPRRLHSFSACAVGGSIIIFGGLDMDAQKPANSVFVFNTDDGAWQNMQDATQKGAHEDAPEPRWEHAAASLEGDRRMIVHGGRNDKDPKPLHTLFCLEVGQRTLRWNRIRLKGGGGDRGGLGTGVAVRTLPLPNRRAQTLCLAGDLSRAFLFGGCSDCNDSNSVTGELFSLIIDKCTTLIVEAENYRGQAPEARAYHTAVLLGPFMGIFGGRNRRGEPLNDFHLLHLASMIWTSPVLQTVPPGFPQAADWPERRWGHAAVTISRTLRGGEGIREGMLILGGQGVDQSYEDAWGLYFEQPTESSAPVRRMADALGAFTDGVLCSLRDRFLQNIGLLRGEHHLHLEDLKTQIEHSQQEVKAWEGNLLKAEKSGIRADKDLHNAEQRAEQVKEQLVEQQEEAHIAREEASEELADAESEIARLRAVLKRLEGSRNIFTAGKLLNFQDVEIEEHDTGIQQSNKCTPAGIVHRQSGFWRGTLVTVETIKMQSAEDISEATGQNAAMQRRLQLEKEKKLRKRWEAATRMELHIISRLRHPCLLEYYGAASDGGGLLLLSEPPLIPLSQRLVEEPRLTELENLDVALDIIQALEYLHCKGITHRHITEENIFLKNLSHVAVKLGGLLPARLTCRAAGAVFVPSSYEPPIPGQSILVPTQDEATDPRKADIFGYGALLMHLYSGHKPEPGKALRSMVQIVDKIADKSIQMVVMKSMEKDPAHRPSARMVLRALTAVADGEVAGMDPLQNDPSMHSTLADDNCVLDDEE